MTATLWLAAQGCATFGRPLHPENPPGSWYVVRPGDTLASLAARDGVPLEDLLEINGLRRTDTIEAGRVIYLLDAQGLQGRLPQLESTAAVEPGQRTGDRTSTSGSSSAAASGPGTGARAAPFRWPLAAPRVTSSFGRRHGRVHEGIDLGAPVGTPILAAGDGLVIYAGNAVRGYGNMVVLQHRGDYLTVYAHNSVLLVRTGDRVIAGKEIARVGQSGRATAPHLHFEVRRGQVPDDPLRFLPALR